MRTALILDHERLAQEHAMFNRLCVALLAEGIHPVRVVPADFDRALEDPEERRVALLPRLPFSPGPLPWTRRARAARLADELDRFGVQLVHAAGGPMWPTAIAVAQELERPLVLGVWSIREATAAHRLRHQSAVSAWLAPSERIAVTLRQRVNPTLVHVVPAGVSVSAHPPESTAAAQPSCFLVGLGDGRDLKAWDAFLVALRRVLDDQSLGDVRLVMEIRGPKGHDIWRRARDLDLLDRISSLADAAQHRALLMRGHGVCLPEPMDTLRTIVLEAMAHGVPVAASDASALDGFEPGSGIELVTEAKVETWVATLQRLLRDRLGVEGICRAAWQHVHRNHRSSAQAEGVAELYRSLVEGDPIRFDSVPRT